ncbi:MAG: hypothetical protein CME61_00485 [Halobacteriovoraceae bacterium]|nr:hypothetical protein [Halobacteriovoraceae bacterium]|tara:strand:+ start:351 stop:893 length:543 start_codon:yes stop_codon:yes gene_type:complete
MRINNASKIRFGRVVYGFNLDTQETFEAKMNGLLYLEGDLGKRFKKFIKLGNTHFYDDGDFFVTFNEDGSENVNILFSDEESRRCFMVIVQQGVWNTLSEVKEYVECACKVLRTELVSMVESKIDSGVHLVIALNYYEGEDKELLDMIEKSRDNENGVKITFEVITKDEFLTRNRKIRIR